MYSQRSPFHPASHSQMLPEAIHTPFRLQDTSSTQDVDDASSARAREANIVCVFFRRVVSLHFTNIPNKETLVYVLAQHLAFISMGSKMCNEPAIDRPQARPSVC